MDSGGTLPGYHMTPTGINLHNQEQSYSLEHLEMSRVMVLYIMLYVIFSFLQLESQLVRIKRELRRKERKLKKYTQVLGAKQHVRETIQRQRVACEEQSTSK